RSCTSAGSRGGRSEQRAEEARGVFEEAPGAGACAPLVAVEAHGAGEVALVVGGEGGDGVGGEEEEVEFEVEGDGADVEVGGADEGEGVVHEHGLAVEEAGAVEPDVDAGVEEVVEVGAAGGVDDGVVAAL